MQRKFVLGICHSAPESTQSVEVDKDAEDCDQVDDIVDQLQASTRQAPERQLDIGSLTAIDVGSIFQ